MHLHFKPPFSALNRKLKIKNTIAIYLVCSNSKRYSALLNCLIWLKLANQKKKKTQCYEQTTKYFRYFKSQFPN